MAREHGIYETKILINVDGLSENLRLSRSLHKSLIDLLNDSGTSLVAPVIGKC